MSNIIYIEYPTTYWSDLLNELHDQMNFEVYFIEPTAKHYNFDIAELQTKAHYKFNYLKRIYLFNRAINTGVFPAIRKHKPQYIITREFSIITLLVALRKKIFREKYTVIVRCDDSYDMVSNKNEFTKIHRIARKILMPWIDNIILVEPRVVEWYHKHYQKGILFPILQKDNDFREKLQKSISISNALINKYKLSGKKVVAFVGRFVKLKNIDILINTFININYPNSVLLLIGDGEEKKTLQNKYKDNEQIIFTGNLQGEKLYAFYNCISVLALLSDREAFGAVINEALLAGAKILASKRAGASFLINGNNGELVNPYDQDIVKTKLEKLIADVPAISCMTDIRPSNMPFTFDHAIKNLIKGIKNT